MIRTWHLRTPETLGSGIVPPCWNACWSRWRGPGCAASCCPPPANLHKTHFIYLKLTSALRTQAFFCGSGSHLSAWYASGPTVWSSQARALSHRCITGVLVQATYVNLRSYSWEPSKNSSNKSKLSTVIDQIKINFCKERRMRIRILKNDAEPVLIQVWRITIGK